MMKDIPNLFGCMVFNDAVMQSRLPKDIYRALKKTMSQGTHLELDVANAVANAMKEWAIEKGVTHFTHWFQPMTGITAEKVDDPVGATSVHLVCGVFGTLCVGIFAQEGVTSLSTVNGLFFGGGLHLLGVEAIGIVAVGVFVFASSSLVWLLLKKIIGIRVCHEEEIRGLDISEHGNSAYPDFAIMAPILEMGNGNGTVVIAPVENPHPVSGTVAPEVAIPVVKKACPGAKMTKVSIITNQDKFTKLQSSLDSIGITGLTVTNVLGHGMQKGHTEYYRGAPVKARLLPKVQVDVVICKIPTETLIRVRISFFI